MTDDLHQQLIQIHRRMTDAQYRLLCTIARERCHENSMRHWWQSLKKLHAECLIEVHDGYWQTTELGRRFIEAIGMNR